MLLGRTNLVPDVSHEATYNLTSTHMEKFILSHSGYSFHGFLSPPVMITPYFSLNFADFRQRYVVNTPMKYYKFYLPILKHTIKQYAKLQYMLNIYWMWLLSSYIEKAQKHYFEQECKWYFENHVSEFITKSHFLVYNLTFMLWKMEFKSSRGTVFLLFGRKSTTHIAIISALTTGWYLLYPLIIVKKGFTSRGPNY